MRAAVAALLALAAAAAWPAPAAAQGNSSSAAGSCGEAGALLAFIAALSNGDRALPGWRQGFEPCADRWAGVECGAGGQVTAL